MQTFLPVPSFRRSAEALDTKRLGKQRVECKQILRALGVPIDGKVTRSGWRNHPAVRMWSGYEYALLTYAITVCKVWRARGYQDSLLEQFVEARNAMWCSWSRFKLPPFVGNDSFHASHRSNLLRKNRGWYSRFGWSEPEDLPYVWPTQEAQA